MLTLVLLLTMGMAPHEARDADYDGFPDAAELKSSLDRQSFRRWFVNIALSRFLDPTEDIKDCAGLVCYAYREALREHNENWRKEFGALVDYGVPDISAFGYPNVPYIGTDIFRLSDGPYTKDDRTSGRLGNFADVPHLLRYHTVKITRRLSDKVLPGDLLFFTPKGKPSHVMIYLEIKGEPYLLYHTGPGEEKKGEMRLVKFRTLMALDEETWRPDESNPAFAGFYRFKILE